MEANSSRRLNMTRSPEREGVACPSRDEIGLRVSPSRALIAVQHRLGRTR